MLLDGWGVDMLEHKQCIINVSSMPDDHQLNRTHPPAKGVVRGRLNGGFQIRIHDNRTSDLTMMLHIDLALTNLSPRMVNHFSGKLIHALPGKIEQAARRPVYTERIAQQPHIYGHIADIVQRFWQQEDAKQAAQQSQQQPSQQVDLPAEEPSTASHG